MIDMVFDWSMVSDKHTPNFSLAIEKRRKYILFHRITLQKKTNKGISKFRKIAINGIIEP